VFVCSQWTGDVRGAFRPRSVDTSTYVSPTVLLADAGTAAYSVDVAGPACAGGWSSDRDAAEPTPKGYKKKQKTDVAHDLSNLVVYTQAVKFRGKLLRRQRSAFLS